MASAQLRVVALLLAAVACADAVSIVVTNKCGYTIHPAAIPGGGTELNTGDSWFIDVPAGTQNGRVWGRTGCGFVINGTLGQCQTGDCGGTLVCRRVGAEPITLAEYSLGKAMDYFDISLVHGFNAPMSFLPTGDGASKCARGGPSCPVQEITFDCPFEQRRKAGCGNPCDGKASCGPNNGTEYFKQRCPQTITYPKDTRGTVYTCPSGTNYEITFCP
jgi:hypothetical protein